MTRTLCAVALLFPSPALAWPASGDWEALERAGSPTSDDGLDTARVGAREDEFDLVGDSSAPVTSWYADDARLYLQLRINTMSAFVSGFDDGCLGFVIDTDGDSSTYELLAGWDTSLDMLYLHENDDAETGFSHTGSQLRFYIDASGAAGLVDFRPASSAFDVFTDGLVELSLPLADLTSLGGLAITDSFRVAAGSSDEHIESCAYFEHDVSNADNSSVMPAVSASLSEAVSIDGDADELYYFDELALGTDPTDNDSDGDGLLDGEEVHTHGTDPLIEDSDKDGLADGEEVAKHGTDPTNPDSDEDGLIDGAELERGADPNNPDSDGDGLLDGDEVLEHGTDPTLTDSDGDGLDDPDEIETHGTDPTDPDCDGDGLNDYEEIVEHGTDPWNSDSDEDGLDDGDEIEHGADPNDSDSDGDGLLDGEEVHTHGTDPASDDSDGDGLLDPDEISTHGTDPNSADSDGDGIGDAEEVACGGADTDDRDGDGISDAVEGAADIDDDGDPDFCDTDADGDGVSDGTEGTADDDCDEVPNFQDPDDGDGPCAEQDGDDTGAPGDDKGDGDGSGSGCSAGAGAAAPLLGLLGLLGLRRRRRPGRR